MTSNLTPNAASTSHEAVPSRADALDVLVVGAGQAGLAVAYHLRKAAVRFLIVDAAAEIGASWRHRWDSLRLFTPAEYDGLPGMPFPAAAGTYPTRSEVADYLQAYAARFELPVLLSARVTRLERDADLFAVHTTQGVLHARQVVVATGPFQTPAVPAVSADLDAAVAQMHSAEYRNPAQIRTGRVLVVGAGNSGRQIALELSATHRVTLAAGAEALQLPQRILGRDLFWWLTRLGVITKTADSRLARRMRARGDLLIGSPLKELRAAGVEIRPRLIAASGATVRFADHSQDRPDTVIWATGFRSDYSWIIVPGVVTAAGIAHERGLSSVPGLSFIGLPWQHTRGSALLGFVKDDAEWLARHITANAAVPGSPFAVGPGR